MYRINFPVGPEGTSVFESQKVFLNGCIMRALSTAGKTQYELVTVPKKEEDNIIVFVIEPADVQEPIAEVQSGKIHFQFPLDILTGWPEKNKDSKYTEYIKYIQEKELAAKKGGTIEEFIQEKVAEMLAMMEPLD